MVLECHLKEVQGSRTDATEFLCSKSETAKRKTYI